MAEYDMVVRNGTLSTASDVFRADIGIIDGRIATSRKTRRGRREINADGHIVYAGVSTATVTSSSDLPWVS